jgi:hypothetical protein
MRTSVSVLEPTTLMPNALSDELSANTVSASKPPGG